MHRAINIFLCAVVAYLVGINQAAAFYLPDTGITWCVADEKTIPCPIEGQEFYGQDASYQFDQPNFEKTEETLNGTVIDHRTGLEWQQLDYRVNNWADAKFYCDGLSLGVHSDWRLPELYELETIVDYRREDPAYDTDYFRFLSEEGLSITWTATESSLPGVVWVIFHDNGFPEDVRKNSPALFPGVPYLPHARCVRGGSGSGPGPYKTNASYPVVSDKGTGLMWQKESSPTLYTWRYALEYCESLFLDLYGDWRLPNIRELNSIVDRHNRNPAIDLGFDNTSPGEYWSSTQYGRLRAWAINFFDGTFENYADTNDHKYSYANHVRCVRGPIDSITVNFTGPGQYDKVLFTSAGNQPLQCTSSESGSSSCTRNFDQGTEVMLTAIPDSNSLFNGWSGACSGTGTCTVTVDGSVTVNAEFFKKISTNRGYIPSVIFLLKSLGN